MGTPSHAATRLSVEIDELGWGLHMAAQELLTKPEVLGKILAGEMRISPALAASIAKKFLGKAEDWLRWDEYPEPPSTKSGAASLPASRPVP